LLAEAFREGDALLAESFREGDALLAEGFGERCCRSVSRRRLPYKERIYKKKAPGEGPFFIP
jgi:hypothetical protein